MYTIIKWANEDNEVYPVLNANGTLKLFEKLAEADAEANGYWNAADYRVISIDGVRG